MSQALVIEGGGMKAAFASGVLAAFEAAGHRPWDAVYGSSAGGALAAWMAAGQAHTALGTWAYAADRRIVSYRRLLRGGPLIDHEALIRIVYEQERPIDVAAIRASRFPVILVATDAATGTAHYQDIRTADVLAWIRATGRLPFLSGPPVEIGGRSMYDGGIVDPIPLRRAIADGHNKITLILNNHRYDKKAEKEWLVRRLAHRRPALRDALVHHAALKAQAVALAEDPPAGVLVGTIAPDRATRLHRLSRDITGINRAIRMGQQAAMDALSVT